MSCRNSLITKISEIFEILDIDTCVYIIGSYGRDEGIIKFTKGKYKLQNDLDILIIYKKRINNNVIKEIKKSISNIIIVDSIDISSMHIRKFNLLIKRNTVFNYDFINSSNFIHGNNDLRLKRKDFLFNDISFSDIRILVYTRGWIVLRLININEMRSRSIETRNELFYKYQISKLNLASIDILNISNRNFKSTYKEKYESIKDLPITNAEKNVLKASYNYKKTLDPKYFANFDLFNLIIFSFNLFFKSSKIGITKYCYFKKSNYVLFILTYLTEPFVLFRLLKNFVFLNTNNLKKIIYELYLFRYILLVQKSELDHLKRSDKVSVKLESWFISKQKLASKIKSIKE